MLEFIRAAAGPPPTPPLHSADLFATLLRFSRVAVYLCIQNVAWMNWLRKNGTWFLLLTMLCIAAPRTLLHDCNNAAHPESAVDHHSDEEALDHAPCQLCDFSATPGIEASAPMTVALEEWQLAPETRFLLSHTAAAFHSTQLRGPPAA